MAVDYGALGTELRLLRLSQERGLRETARALGMSDATLIAIERGHCRRAQLDTVARLAAYVGHPLAHALPRAADPERDT